MKGIVLMGGLSRRMGTDKAFLLWAGKPLYRHVADKMWTFCDEIYLSVNSTQKEKHSFDYPLITDFVSDEGPISAIISCHRTLRDVLLVMACDMPFVTQDEILSLIDAQNLGNNCSLYYNARRAQYEPMLSIWDPGMLDNLEAYFVNGGRSLQRFLSDNNIAKKMLREEKNFRNLNTKDDWEKF